jgi:PAS domain S-box-containing protein
MTVADLPEDWARAMLQVSLDGQFILRACEDEDDFDVLYANEAGAKFFDVVPADLISRRLNDLLPPSGTGLRDSLREALRTGLPVHRPNAGVSPSLNITRIEYRVLPFGKCIAVSVIDRSAQYEVEQEATLLRRVLQDGLKASPLATALLTPLYDDDGNIVDAYVEQANAGSLAGPSVTTTKGGVTGNKLSDVVGLELDLVLPLMERAMQGQVVVDELPGAPLGASAQLISVHLAPVKPFLLLFAEDVSKTRQREAMLSAIVERAAEIILFTDPRGILQYVNPYALDKLGYTDDDVLGISMVEFAVPEDRQSLVEEAALLLAGEPPSSRRIRVLDSHGAVLTLLGSTVALWNKSGGLAGFITVATDLTQRLKAEEAREQLAGELTLAEQYERDRLAEDLHDGPVQNLTALSLLLGSWLSGPDSLSAAKTHLGRAEDIVVSTIADLRGLMFRLSTPELKGDRLVQHIHQRAERLFEGTNVRVHFVGELDSPPSDPVAVGLFRLAQEALVNVLKHAQASRVTVSLQEDAKTNSIVMEIQDDGVGALSSAYLRHRPGHLGVSMMMDRARYLGGSLSIEGSPGDGTFVRVVLPRFFDPGNQRHWPTDL